MRQYAYGTILAASVVLNIAAAGFYARRWFSQPIHPGIPAFNTDLYEFASRHYSREPLSPATTMMLGDSLADAVADDTKLFDDRAIPSETTIGLERRLDAIIALHPQDVMVWEGVNDLAAGRTPAETAKTLDGIVARLHDADTAVTLVSVLHVVSPAASSNHDIDALDDALAIVAKSRGARWIDIRAVADDPALRTPDGVHLTAQGLQVIKIRLRPTPCHARETPNCVQKILKE